MPKLNEKEVMGDHFQPNKGKKGEKVGGKGRGQGRGGIIG